MNEKTKSRDTLSFSEISAFCAQMSMILKSGISLAEGIGIMRDDAENPDGKSILAIIHDDVEKGTPLFTALEKTDKFPDYMLTMIEIGEATGKLENVMESLTSYYEREEAIARTIRSAVAYPLVMIAMMLAVIIILIVQVMPIFSEVFQGLGAQMTGFPLAVMNFGQALSNYSMVIVIVLVVIAAALLIMRSTRAGKEALVKFKENFIFTRSLYAKIASGKFASAMSLMLASGMDTDKSLEMVHKLVDTPSIRVKIAKCQRLLADGTNFSDSLVHVGMFSGVYARMVSVAFKTGAMDNIMEKLAVRYEEETNAQINNIISIVEPSLVAVLSVIVGVILLSVMLPLMGIMAAIG
ncbi:MAG: type II secretion system F family protein [Defluviitaleaceae bacterium]|nr:type II secretion system F family protein [Defluviitaleaceae bacterium]